MREIINFPAKGNEHEMGWASPTLFVSRIGFGDCWGSNNL
jgi:hypothetical protein